MNYDAEDSITKRLKKEFSGERRTSLHNIRGKGSLLTTVLLLERLVVRGGGGKDEKKR